MKEDGLLVAGPRKCARHWLTVDAKCVVEKNMSMANELSEKSTGGLHHKLLAGSDMADGKFLESIEYENLSDIYFLCDIHGHRESLCPSKNPLPNNQIEFDIIPMERPSSVNNNVVMDYGLWMVLTRRGRRPQTEERYNRTKESYQDVMGTRFNVLNKVVGSLDDEYRKEGPEGREGNIPEVQVEGVGGRS
ncbi:hypothetical protein JCGZ_23650 [Jatropha curcas]|uniref:Zinc knuckle CX2CX4HX4C domain-containing protein n=1 Tax=Jatropha curcas TaxID=180498 RepID=A0A067LE10_JATCU|nr:hypothetical protein JCGZ_23650 [Jatropha curcas]